MSDYYDYGPLLTYEVIWRSGHVETIRCHQVTLTTNLPSILGGSGRPARVMFHGEIDGHWRLVLTALESDIATIREISVPEVAQ